MQQLTALAICTKAQSVLVNVHILTVLGFCKTCELRWYRICIESWFIT